MLRGLLILCFVCIMPNLAAAQERPFRVNTGFVAPVSDIYKLILEDAFARLEIKLDFQEVPAERSISLVNDGTDDAECCRIWEINKTYKNLVPIPIELINMDFMAFSSSAEMRIAGWNDLTPYDVGVVHGWKILEVGLAMHKPRRLLTLSTPASMFNMLNSGRIQVATIDRLVGYQTAADMGMRGIQVHEPPLVSRPLYLQIHRKHESLAPRLTQTLATMRAEGLLQHYYRQVVDPLERALNLAGQNDQPP